jgi:ABC-type lipoprotein export system ATPase subunit
LYQIWQEPSNGEKIIFPVAGLEREDLMDPDIVLADEPTGNLDTSSGTEIMGLFTELWKQGRTMVIISHDPALARRALRVVEIRDGRIMRDGPSTATPSAPPSVHSLE